MAKPQKVTADPLGARNSHHVRLFRLDDADELTDEIGLVLCGSDAEENFKALEVVHTPQESLKTSSGATEYSDFEPPYSSLEFDDWSLGRGFADHNKQKSAYLDAKAMFTVKEDFLYPCGEAQKANLPTDYFKLNNELDVGDTGVPPTVLFQRKIGFPEGTAPDQYHMRYGSMFYSREDYTSITTLHIDLTPVWNISSDNLPVLQVLIYEVTPTTEADVNADPICYLPNTSSLVSTMTMDASSVVGVENNVPKEIRFVDTTGFNLSADTLYYACMDVTVESLEDYWMIDIRDGNLFHWAQEVKSTDGGAWVATQNCGIHWAFYMTGAGNPFKAHFAEINRCLHVGIEFLDGSAGVLFRNGELGLGNFQDYTPSATENGRFVTLTDIPLTYQDQILKILEGPGAATNRDWSRITANADDGAAGTALSLTHRFGLANADQTNESKFVITNSLEFVEIVTSPAIDQPISDILSAMGALYISFSEKKNVHRLRYLFDYVTPEVTIEWADEQYWADMMAQQVRAGNNYIWRIRSLLSQIVPADAVNLRDAAVTDALNFETDSEVYVGNTEYRINSWAIYGDDPHFWVMKEDKPYEIVAEDVYEFRNSAMSSMVDSRNGRAAIQHDTYLHFSFHDGVQRWHYNGDLLNHGPEVIGPAGMPWNRQGSFADFAGYGDILVGAFDGGEQGQSSLLAWNGSGWCELYRSGAGQRILSCYVQSMDGKPVDWLWFSEGSKIMRIPVSTNPLGQMNDEYFYYPFALNATLDSSWISLGLKDVSKYINKFKVVSFKAPSPYDVPVDSEGIPVCENPAEDEVLNAANPGTTYYTEGVTIGWRTDPCKNFTYYTDGVQDPLIMLGETEVNAIVDAEAEQIQYQVGIVGATEPDGKVRYPIVIDTLVMDSIVRLPHKAQIRVQFRLRDNDVGRQEMPDPYPTVKEKYDLLEVYSNQAAPVYGQLDAKFVGERRWFIDQGSLQVVEKLEDQNLETWVMTMVLKEA